MINKFNERGFTLIELLVVIAIVAMLAAYALPNYRQYVVKTKRAEAHSKILEISGMYEKFYANTNAYPTDLKGGGTALSLTDAYLISDDYSVIRSTDANAAPADWRIQANAQGNQNTDDPNCRVIWFDSWGRKGPLNSVCWND